MSALSSSFEALYRRQDNAWVKRHVAAWNTPEGFESALKGMIVGFDEYGHSMRSKLGTPPGEDMFLGPAFKQIAEAVLILLNGDLGRFDGGTLDSLVRAICTENGVELDQ